MWDKLINDRTLNMSLTSFWYHPKYSSKNFSEIQNDRSNFPCLVLIRMVECFVTSLTGSMIGNLILVNINGQELQVAW